MAQGLDGDVRGFVWGLPKSVIMEEEKNSFLFGEFENTVTYETKEHGHKSYVTYVFDEKEALARADVQYLLNYGDPQ